MSSWLKHELIEHTYYKKVVKGIKIKSPSNRFLKFSTMLFSSEHFLQAIANTSPSICSCLLRQNTYQIVFVLYEQQQKNLL